MEPVKHFIGKAEELLGPANAPPRPDGHKCGGGEKVHDLGVVQVLSMF